MKVQIELVLCAKWYTHYPIWAKWGYQELCWLLFNGTWSHSGHLNTHLWTYGTTNSNTRPKGRLLGDFRRPFSFSFKNLYGYICVNMYTSGLVDRSRIDFYNANSQWVKEMINTWLRLLFSTFLSVCVDKNLLSFFSTKLQTQVTKFLCGIYLPS